MTEDALAIVDQAILAVDPYSAIRNHLAVDENGEKLIVGGGSPREYYMKDFDDIVVVAFGKASAAMATGSAWKFPPDTILSSSANTIGLSDTAFASFCKVLATKRMLSWLWARAYRISRPVHGQSSRIQTGN